jgi:hypothetical protein
MVMSSTPSTPTVSTMTRPASPVGGAAVGDGDVGDGTVLDDGLRVSPLSDDFSGPRVVERDGDVAAVSAGAATRGAQLVRPPLPPIAALESPLIAAGPTTHQRQLRHLPEAEWLQGRGGAWTPRPVGGARGGSRWMRGALGRVDVNTIDRRPQPDDADVDLPTAAHGDEVDHATDAHTEPNDVAFMTPPPPPVRPAALPLAEVGGDVGRERPLFDPASSAAADAPAGLLHRIVQQRLARRAAVRHPRSLLRFVPPAPRTVDEGAAFAPRDPLPTSDDDQPAS